MIDSIEEFVCEDLDDPIDVVIATDRDIDAAIERAEEKADTMAGEDLIRTMQEAGDLEYTGDDEEEAMMYDEDEDDAVDIADVDGQDYRESLDMNEWEDMEEDDEIDIVIDSDPQAAEIDDYDL